MEWTLTHPTHEPVHVKNCTNPDHGKLDSFKDFEAEIVTVIVNSEPPPGISASITL